MLTLGLGPLSLQKQGRGVSHFTMGGLLYLLTLS